MSNSKVKELFTILMGVLLISSCGQPTPAELPIATSVSTSQSSATPPTMDVSPIPPIEQVSPTPTDSPFELPGGRFLFTAYPKSGGTDITDTDFQYLWLGLHARIVQAHPYLIGEYPALDYAVALSPDSSWLAFEHRVYSQSSTDSFPQISASVHLASPDGEAIQIGPTLSNDFITDNFRTGTTISWSANSQVLAFAQTSNWLSFDKEKYLYMYDVPSGKFSALTIQTAQPNAFELSPDGTQVAFTDLGASPGLSLINADGSNQRVIVEGWVSSNLAWHPDGKRIFFVRDEPVIAIYSVDVSSGAITPITPRNQNLDSLRLSPDGNLLTYYENGLFVVNADGGEPLQLAGAGVRQWVWSPDSQYIAYVTPAKEIYVMDTRGHGKVQVYYDEQMLPGLIGWLP